MTLQQLIANASPKGITDATELELSLDNRTLTVFDSQGQFFSKKEYSLERVYKLGNLKILSKQLSYNLQHRSPEMFKFFHSVKYGCRKEINQHADACYMAWLYTLATDTRDSSGCLE